MGRPGGAGGSRVRSGRPGSCLAGPWPSASPLAESPLPGWSLVETSRLACRPGAARSRRRSGSIPRSASRAASVGANSSTRIPSAVTKARTVTGPNSSGATRTVIRCSPFEALARLNTGLYSWVASGTVGTDAAGAGGAVAAMGSDAGCGADGCAAGTTGCRAAADGSVTGVAERGAPAPGTGGAGWVGAAWVGAPTAGAATAGAA